MYRIKYKYKPLIKNIYLFKKNNKDRIVTLHLAYGYICCFELNGDFIDSLPDTIKNENKFKKCGKIIIPRWEKFILKWISDGIIKNRKIGSSKNPPVLSN